MKRTVVKTCPFEREALVRKHYQNDIPFKMAYKNGTLSNFYETIGAYSKVSTDYVDEYEYKVPAKEVVTILKQGVVDGIFDFSFSEKDKMRYAADILFHCNKDNFILQDDELIKAAIKQNSSVFNILPEEIRNKWYIYYLTCHPSKAADEANESILMEALEVNPKIFEHIPKDNVTEKLLYAFLERCVKGLYKPTSYYWSNIPDSLKNKVYYQGKAMMNPYYLCEVPVEYQTAKLYEWISEHIGDSYRGYTEPLSVLQ